jgi:hypothetical protein
MIYLVQYNRKQGQLVSLDAFPAQSKQGAEEARLRMELQLLGHHDTVEVVLLEARNKRELRKTHRRYFERLDQLMAN